MRSPLASARRRSAFSTRITELSTTRPKSIAPSDMSVPAMPNRSMPLNANSIESGIAAATMRPARRLPRNTNSTAMTRSAPSSRFVLDGVEHVVDELGALVDGLDRDVLRQALLRPRRAALASAVVTAWLFSPISMKPRPSTASPLPSAVVAPRRISWPTSTRATSRTRIGTPRRARRSTTSSIARPPVERADAEDEARPAAALDDAAADVRVVRLERAVDVAERQVELLQPLRIDDDVPLLLVAAPGVHLGDARARSGAGARSPSRGSSGAPRAQRVLLFTR